MEFRTKVEIEAVQDRVDYDSRICMLGSCFAENIGQRLKYYRFRTELNPCGIVYNPMSVANVLKLMLAKYRFTERDLLYNADKWVSLYHHGSFSAPTKELCLEHINERLGQAADGFEKTDLLLMTFGTAWVYRYKERGMIVANCHRFPAGDFERFCLTPEEIVDVYRPLIRQLREVNPKLRIVFTVSPIRHWKDGAHGNQLSKAVLLLAIDRLVREFPDVYYFPAYEIVMDELRDYRFYGEDMLHISSLTVEYIWEKFKGTWISPAIESLMKRVDKLNKSLAHRPFSPESDAYRKFQQQLRQEIETLQQMNQNIDFTSVSSSGV